MLSPGAADPSFAVSSLALVSRRGEIWPLLVIQQVAARVCSSSQTNSVQSGHLDRSGRMGKPFFRHGCRPMVWWFTRRPIGAACSIRIHLARDAQRRELEGIVARGPTSSSSRGRGRSRSKVAARLPSTKSGRQVSRACLLRQPQRQSIRAPEKTECRPKSLGLPPITDPRGMAPSGTAAGTMTTADDFDDFIIDEPITPPIDEEAEELAGNKH